MEGVIALLILLILAVPITLLVLLVSVSALKRRVATLERHLAEAVRAPTPTPTSVVDRDTPPPAPVRGGVVETPEAPPLTAPSASVVSSPAPPPAPPPPPPPAPPRTSLADHEHTPVRPDLIARLSRTSWHWLSHGNVPVKVGMLVLLAGVAALLRYAGQQGWLTLPPTLRYAGIAAAALVALLFGWRQRDRRRGFALTLQGGAIGVLLLVLFAACRLHGLLPTPAAFALSVALVAGLCVLAVAQDSRTLAVFGILAGFLAPIWLSTGQGSHVALFAYYAVLNVAVFAIAWWRKWRVLNLIGFVFTFGIGTLWGVLRYRPEHFASTEPFLLLFFAIYLLIPVLHAQHDGEKARVVDGSLLFGTPLIAFSLQAGLLRGQFLPLALCALALAAIYTGLALWLRRRASSYLLGQGQALLAAAFVTLAVPLALSAQASSGVFALESVGVLWLGVRQPSRRWLAWLSGGVLQLAALAAFVIAVDVRVAASIAVFNGVFIGALLLVLAGLASAQCLRLQRCQFAALLVYLYALLLWTAMLGYEIVTFAATDQYAYWALLALAVSGWLAAEAQRRRPAACLVWTTAMALALSVFVAWSAYGPPFAGAGALSWPLSLLLWARALCCLRSSAGVARDLAQICWLVLLALLLVSIGAWIGFRLGLGEGWRGAMAMLPWLLAAALGLCRWRWLAWPQSADFNRRRGLVLGGAFVLLGLHGFAQMFSSAEAAPLPWLPLLNPLELGHLAALLLALRWLGAASAPARLRRHRALLLSVLALLFFSVIVLRGVHHWGGEDWDAALLSSSPAQASLSVAWSVLGVIGWVLGSRRGQRGLWWLGAGLMALVLLKLVLVDRHHLGNLFGIGSFIVYGLLCTVVGYLAPAPPRSQGVQA